MGADLGTFEGRDVVRTRIAVTNAGDGLSEALGIDPQVFHLGDEVDVVLRCVVSKVHHLELKDTEVLERVHILKAGTATIVLSDMVAAQLEEQALKNEAARREASGVLSMPVDEHNLRGDHVLGQHADGLVENCPLCQEEKDAEAREADES